ncbi:MAG: hydroxylamine reductase [Bacteroidota bacterium]
MFCYQCEETAGGKGCTRAGVCGKKPEVADRQDELTGALVGLARAAAGKTPDREVDGLVMRGLFMTLTNVCFDESRFAALLAEVRAAADRLGGAEEMAASALWAGDPDIVSLRSTLLLGLRGMAAYAWHARALGHEDAEVNAWLYHGLRAVGAEHTVSEWLDLLLAFGQVNLRCLELLDRANTTAYGNPSPAAVSTTRKKGPFIVVSGHDLRDLAQLLEQTAGKGINVYTHGEMLPAHGYPALRKHPHLAGHFGTAWQNQRREFADQPGAFLFTTNCLMPPENSYADRVFTTGVAGYPGLRHLEAGPDGRTDFAPVIQKALALGGWTETIPGPPLTTGFARQAVLDAAGEVIAAVKSGAIRRFFLVGGCDGSKPGRNYYTEFVRRTPADTVILTLGCGKFRFNHLDLGQIGGLPRLLDMGQCNDAYGAIRVAQALAEAFGCGVNDLPLTLVLSWYEQKAVCILLTLLALGIKDIRLGPTLPAFISPRVLQVLVEKWGIKPITTPEEDLRAVLG